MAATQQRVAKPFHYRWLLPALLGNRIQNWAVCTHLSVIAVAVLTAVYTRSPWMVCVALLPAMRFTWHHPVLVDAAGMALALAAAVVLPYSLPIALLLAALSGCVRETAPVWAAVYAWNPVLLVGLIPVAVRALQRPGNDVLDYENAWILAHPIRASKKYHAGQWLDPRVMLLPWGGMLAGLAAFDLRLTTAIALGYGQLLVATDSVRLYQWAAPVVAWACVQALPFWALPLVAVSVVFNPLRGPGI